MATDPSSKAICSRCRLHHSTQECSNGHLPLPVCDDCALAHILNEHTPRPPVAAESREGEVAPGAPLSMPNKGKLVCTRCGERELTTAVQREWVVTQQVSAGYPCVRENHVLLTGEMLQAPADVRGAPKLLSLPGIPVEAAEFGCASCGFLFSALMQVCGAVEPTKPCEKTSECGPWPRPWELRLRLDGTNLVVRECTRCGAAYNKDASHKSSRLVTCDRCRMELRPLARLADWIHPRAECTGCKSIRSLIFTTGDDGKLFRPRQQHEEWAARIQDEECPFCLRTTWLKGDPAIVRGIELAMLKCYQCHNRHPEHEALHSRLCSELGACRRCGGSVAKDPLDPTIREVCSGCGAKFDVTGDVVGFDHTKSPLSACPTCDRVEEPPGGAEQLRVEALQAKRRWITVLGLSRRDIVERAKPSWKFRVCSCCGTTHPEDARVMRTLQVVVRLGSCLRCETNKTVETLIGGKRGTRCLGCGTIETPGGRGCSWDDDGTLCACGQQWTLGDARWETATRNGIVPVRCCSGPICARVHPADEALIARLKLSRVERDGPIITEAVMRSASGRLRQATILPEAATDVPVGIVALREDRERLRLEREVERTSAEAAKKSMEARAADNMRKQAEASARQASVSEAATKIILAAEMEARAFLEVRLHAALEATRAAEAKALLASALPRLQGPPSPAELYTDGADGSSSDCCVCMDAKPDATLLRCGHIAVCCVCAAKLVGKPCPICRTVIADFVRNFRS
jgi:hypothetical protein